MTKKASAHPIQQAFDDPDVAKLYANAFECALGVGDVAVLLKNADKTVAVVNMSHTVAKTLATRLHELIRFLETKSGTPVMTTPEVEKALKPQKTKEATLQ